MTGDEHPQPPLVPGADNFRDVGGLRAGEGRTRPGVLYRSGNLAGLEDSGISALRALGIRRIIDLRADDEISYAPSRIEGLDLVTQRVPLFTGPVSALFADDIGLDEMYRRLVVDSAAGVVEVVRGIIADQPVLVHCTVGKDRTGVAVALALAAAGVDEDDVVADYARTEGLLPAGRTRRIVEMLQSMHPDALHIEDLATRSPGPVMRAMLAGIRDQFGSPADYLRSNGLTDDELDELRRVLVSEEGLTA